MLTMQKLATTTATFTAEGSSGLSNKMLTLFSLLAACGEGTSASAPMMNDENAFVVSNRVRVSKTAEPLTFGRLSSDVVAMMDGPPHPFLSANTKTDPLGDDFLVLTKNKKIVELALLEHTTSRRETSSPLLPPTTMMMKEEEEEEETTTKVMFPSSDDAFGLNVSPLFSFSFGETDTSLGWNETEQNLSPDLLTTSSVSTNRFVAVPLRHVEALDGSDPLLTQVRAKFDGSALPSVEELKSTVSVWFEALTSRVVQAVGSSEQILTRVKVSTDGVILSVPSFKRMRTTIANVFSVSVASVSGCATLAKAVDAFSGVWEETLSDFREATGQSDASTADMIGAGALFLGLLVVAFHSLASVLMNPTRRAHTARFRNTGLRSGRQGGRRRGVSSMPQLSRELFPILEEDEEEEEEEEEEGASFAEIVTVEDESVTEPGPVARRRRPRASKNLPEYRESVLSHRVTHGDGSVKFLC
jgi:hypothetical protein